MDHQVDSQKKVYFYAPDKQTHRFFEQEREEVIKACSNSFTAWIVSTYLQVKQVGISCEVIDHIPQKGIVIADRDTLGNKYPYLGQAMLICAKSDKEFHPSAHLHVVHNSAILDKTGKNSLWKPYYIPHWSQPGLVPRSHNRGSLVENVAFIGTRTNLAKEFFSEKWVSALKDLGCRWIPVFDSEKWSDYSNIDVIIAIRDFDQHIFSHKPASKLINSWHASVPAILAPESAFLSIRNSELDFLIVHSIEEAISAVRELKNNPTLYFSMIEHGLNRAQEFSDEKITDYWITFFKNYVFPEYDRWLKSSTVSRMSLFLRRYFRLKTDRIRRRLLGKHE
ncbi:hypothetical protein BST81_25960 [Leptolyngbya sp. 'hensonii']|nr:hypothetical protein BST81_25960 [Leptolyngbya sp. 'hensonii']